jgi:hypothetical protein
MGIHVKAIEPKYGIKIYESEASVFINASLSL